MTRHRPNPSFCHSHHTRCHESFLAGNEQFVASHFYSAVQVRSLKDLPPHHNAVPRLGVADGLRRLSAEVPTVDHQLSVAYRSETRCKRLFLPEQEALRNASTKQVSVQVEGLIGTWRSINIHCGRGCLAGNSLCNHRSNQKSSPPQRYSRNHP